MQVYTICLNQKRSNNYNGDIKNKNKNAFFRERETLYDSAVTD